MLRNTIKWSMILSLVGGLSSCLMYEQGRNEQQAPMSYEQQAATKQVKGSKTAAVKASSSSSKEPVQKTTPGPKRAAAPQLPVIQ
ncbi:hypothetical protein [Legionella sp. km772]|uniref:hypothetical protein n=1 Tax=Legionella sp. km772 TaxID=2498111 RepID=UPI000F8EB843|nr:hypothetical protein [Legionella sp. km772]RUR12585.1 hypothetical protein ELY15_04665 [Legionella sp. km772]